MENLDILISRIDDYEYRQLRELRKGRLTLFILIGFMVLGEILIWISGLNFLNGVLLLFIMLILFILIPCIRDIVYYSKSISIRKSGYMLDDIQKIALESEFIYKKISHALITKKYYKEVGLRTNYFDNLIKYYIYFLSNLRSDLNIYIKKHQEILKHAKQELTEKVLGDSEFSEIGELQSARLDRQIEQFEELQRVLVKV